LLFIAALAFFPKIIKRAFELRDAIWQEVQIHYGGFEGSVTEQALDSIYVRAMVEQVGCKGMP